MELEICQQIRRELDIASPDAEQLAQAQVRLDYTHMPPISEVAETALTNQRSSSIYPCSQLVRRFLGLETPGGGGQAPSILGVLAVRGWGHPPSRRSRPPCERRYLLPRLRRWGWLCR